MASLLFWFIAHYMLPLNHKRTTSSLAPPIFYVAKKLSIKRYLKSNVNLFVPAITSVEITAHAQVEAMGLVRAKKLISVNIDDPGHTVFLAVVVVVVVASEVAQVGNNWELSMRVLVDGREPVKVAIA